MYAHTLPSISVSWLFILISKVAMFLVDIDAFACKSAEDENQAQ